MMGHISIDDKYLLDSGTALMSAPQAIVRVLLEQARRDRLAGLSTAGFVSGYRGSPLGGIDTALQRASRHLDAAGVRFQPGVNEELAATSVHGSQQAGLFPDARHDGVFAVWYGKGPGVDRAGDALKHGNLAGSARHGGVLILAGDDHGGKSSTTCHQSEQALVASMIPVLYPANVQEYLDYGLLGLAMSRHSGAWVALKCVADTADSTATVAVGPDRGRAVSPSEPLPADGLNLRQPDSQAAQEQRLVRNKLPAVQAFARANRIDRVVLDSSGRGGIGIVTAGKAYLDVMQALRRLGLDGDGAARLGLRVYKAGLIWPMEPEALRAFARGHREILVVEEKRSFMEGQVRDLLYDLPDAERPRVVGKGEDNGAPLLPADGELNPVLVAVALAERLRLHSGFTVASVGDGAATLPTAPATPLVRTAAFCSGCPHNTSTQVPADSLALAGIGCHVMAAFMPERRTMWPVQMGGEGANWIGAAPFTGTAHVFQNLGDGTFFHSGSLAIRAAVAAGVNVTYKLLYNDAVAMTGGQRLDGTLTVPQAAHLLLHEGVRRVVVVADDPERYRPNAPFPESVLVRSRTELDAVQRELRAVPGTTAIIYDQVCAAEKRRRRKRGTMSEPNERLFINPLVCEGCGDCGAKSNCVSLQPLETEFGRKRRIDQSSCNKDWSCLTGFCPSFVTVRGVETTPAASAASPAWTVPELPEPPHLGVDRPYSVLVPGVGGTGVVTVGALIAMAAHLEGKAASVMDMTGLSQKNGAVLSHVKVAGHADEILAARISAQEADLVLGCDAVVAGSREVIATIRSGATRAVVNAHVTATAAFARTPDLELSLAPIVARLKQLCASIDGTSFLDATRIATVLLGDAISANVLLLGFAVQRGLLPVSCRAVEKAIGLNGAQVELNLRAFGLGRWAAVDGNAVDRLVDGRQGHVQDAADPGLQAVVERRARFLTEYQDARYAARYLRLVERVRHAEYAALPGSEALALGVTHGLFKLMAYKDEYEVARLHGLPAFGEQVRSRFKGPVRITFHLAPPLLAGRDAATGEPRKMEFGSWVLPVFRMLARMRRLRGTPLDVFGRTQERRQERRMIADYEIVIEELIAGLSASNLELAVLIARLPEQARGFGHVKATAVARIEEHRDELLRKWRVRQTERETVAA